MPGARLRLMAFEVPAGADTAQARRSIDASVADLENAGARAFVTGRCTACPDGCARSLGSKCRHPEAARSSLQACGLNLVRAAEDLLGISLGWAPGEKTILIAGLLIPNNNEKI